MLNGALRNAGEVLAFLASFLVDILEGVGEFFAHYLHVRLSENPLVVTGDVTNLKLADAYSAPAEDGIFGILLGSADVTEQERAVCARCGLIAKETVNEDFVRIPHPRWDGATEALVNLVEE